MRSKAEVTQAATLAIRSHCRQFKTITFDYGTEFHDDDLLEERFPVKWYGVAKWQQREFQFAAAAVPTQGDVHALGHTGAARSDL